ncbi:MAG: 30S ribosomal protein S12 methylthiotransferase RimO [Desulfohalobiaceae bacterium]|nr:30S ribosomal protein S12 methylthiotransferase RimO [Desulfohalobiaceae bacterium]
MKQDSPDTDSIRVHTVSLGCPKNRIDTEKMLGRLGPEYYPADSPNASEVILVNTCSFIQPAVEESLQTILELAGQIKDLDPKPLLVVTGCLQARYGPELPPKLPEVDLWISFKEQDQWDRLIKKSLGDRDPRPGFRQADLERARLEPARVISTGPGFAYLKINEGCNHDCSFCLIPTIRGPLVSQPVEDLVLEAEGLLAGGVQEICIVAQDITAYGKDLGLKNGLKRLLERLAPLPGLRRLRLMYLYPSGVTRDLLSFLKQMGPPLLPYFDIPLQHAHPEILSRMGRPFQANPARTIDLIRDFFPEACLRTTFITGFPGESEEHFQALYRFVRDTSLNHVGVFAFSPEEGTRAAGLKPVVPDTQKQKRRNRLLELQAEISSSILSESVGQEMEILIDQPDPEWPTLFQGRTWFQAPEVDGITYVSSLQARPGQMIRCRIQESKTYDLTALDESGP